MTLPLDPSQLFEDLSLPSAFPGRPHQVAVVESRSSWLFVAGTTVYKIRKPGRHGRFDLDDYKTRLDLCDEESRLNRRLSPEIYLGVVPITRDAMDRLRVQGQGDMVGWAVSRSWLPERIKLAKRLASGADLEGFFRDLGKRIAQLHHRTMGAGGASRHADPDRLLRAGEARLEALASFVKRVDIHDRTDVGVLTQRQLDALSRSFNERWDRARESLTRRVKRGLPGDGHGALELDHLFCGPDRAWILGANVLMPEERLGDPARDVLNLVVDLEQRGHLEAADVFLREYIHRFDESLEDEVLEFFRVERSVARALVAANVASASEGAVRESALEEANRLAMGVTSVDLPTGLLWMGGLPGAWSPRQLEAVGRTQQAFVIEVREHEAALRTAAAELSRGQTVLMAGGFLTLSDRLQLGELAAGLDVPLHVVHAQTSEADCLDNLNGSGGAIGNSNFGAFLRAKKLFEAPEEFSRVIRWSTTEGAAALDAALLEARLA